MEIAWQSDDDSASSTDSSGMQISPGKNNSSNSSTTTVSCTPVSHHQLQYTSPLFNPDFDLTLDDRSVLAAIRQLNFIQMKRKFVILCIRLPKSASEKRGN